MDALEDALIEHVKRHPILYRSKEKTHFSIMCKYKRWLEIAKALKLTPEECKAKWRNIRDSYLKHIKKKKLGTSPAVSKYDDEKLSFLSEWLLDEPIINDDYSSSSCNSFEGEKKVDPLDDDFTSLADSKPINEIKSDIEIHFTQPAQAKVHIDSTLNDSEDVTPHKKRKCDTIKKPHEPEDETNIHLHDRSARARREGSPTHNFFSSMADIVCKFPPEKIAEMRMRVCCLVSEMEVQILRDGGESS